MASLGLGYPELEKINPAIIMTSITPFGQTGPYAQYKVTDIVLMGMGGLMRHFGDPDRAPVRFSQPQTFVVGGMFAVESSIMAHYYRQATGQGQHVDVSCREAIILTNLFYSESWEMVRYNYQRQGVYWARARPAPLGSLVSQHIYPCKDGFVAGYIHGGAQAGLVQSSRALTEWANSLGYALEIKDYEWTRLDLGTVPQAELSRLQGALGAFLLTRTKAEIMEKALEKGLFMIPVNLAKEVIESPQFKATEFFVQVEYPELGQVITYPGFSVKMSGLSYRVQRRAPLIGEHNEEVYVGELGFSREELARLKASSII